MWGLTCYSTLTYTELFSVCRSTLKGIEYRGTVNVTQNQHDCLRWQDALAFVTPEEAELIHSLPDTGHNYCRNPKGFRKSPWCFVTALSTLQNTSHDLCDIPICGMYFINLLCSKILSSNCVDKIKTWWQNNGVQLFIVYIQHAPYPINYICICCNVQYALLWFTLSYSIPECRKHKQAKEYIGVKNITRSGIPCQHWSSQLPHAHVYNNTRHFLDIELPNNFCRNPSGDSGGLWCYTQDPLVRRDYCDVPHCRA